MVSEAGAEETTTQVEQAAVELPYPEVAGGSTMWDMALDMALVVVSTSLPCPPHTSQSSNNQCLEDDVVLEFDATHRLSKLTMVWEDLLAGVTSFGE
jgi:hypothetical protein